MQRICKTLKNQCRVPAPKLSGNDKMPIRLVNCVLNTFQSLPTANYGKCYSVIINTILFFWKKSVNSMSRALQGKTLRGSLSANSHLESVLLGVPRRTQEGCPLFVTLLVTISQTARGLRGGKQLPGSCFFNPFPLLPPHF